MLVKGATVNKMAGEIYGLASCETWKCHGRGRMTSNSVDVRESKKLTRQLCLSPERWM